MMRQGTTPTPAGVGVGAVEEEGRAMRTRRTRTSQAKAGAEHDRRRLVAAADWAITSAWRRRAPGEAEVWVTVQDVRTQALEQFGLEVPASSAAAMLRERFTLRGAGLGMVTDAFDVDGV
jgi:hypothetical protein